MHHKYIDFYRKQNNHYVAMSNIILVLFCFLSHDHPAFVVYQKQR